MLRRLGLIVTDASPLITLAAGEALECLGRAVAAQPAGDLDCVIAQGSDGFGISMPRARLTG